MRSTFLSAFLTAAVLAASPSIVTAHGNDQPQHGGIVKTSGESVVELVVRPDGAEVYLREEVDDVPSAGLTGKVVVVKDGARTETALVPAGDNRLVAKGAKIVSGSRVSVQIVLADGARKIAANYAIP